MPRSMVPLLMVLAGCAWRLGPPAVTYGAEAATLPLVTPSTDRSRWYVPIEVGGEPWLLFVDTGYSYTTCDDGLIEALGLETRGRKQVRGELGMIDTAKARLPPIEVGGHRLEGLVCLVRDIGSTSSITDPPEIPVAAVLGIDALWPFRVELDPGAGVVRLEDPADAPPIQPGPHTMPLRREYLLGTRVRVPIRIEGAETRPILDTGAGGTYVDGERLGLVATRTDENVRVRGSGPGGEIRTDRVYYDVEELILAGHDAAPLTLTDRPRPPGTPGLLGLDVLDRYLVELDFVRGRARVTPVHCAERPTWTDWSAAGELPVRVPKTSP